MDIYLMNTNLTLSQMKTTEENNNDCDNYNQSNQQQLNYYFNIGLCSAQFFL